jgi:hypothetical protein
MRRISGLGGRRPGDARRYDAGRSVGRDGNFISLSAHSARFDLLRLF